MSAQAGVMFFDHRLVRPEVVATLRRSLLTQGPDGVGEYIAPGIAMLHAAAHITPEDRLGRQPVVSTLGAVMTFDGRLDNRRELLLQLWHDLNDDTTDAALALCAYEKWGVDGFARLIGDWSLVLLDRDRLTLVMASDYMRVRPLHFSANTDCVCWSTSLQSLIEFDTLSGDIDLRFVVGYLTGIIPPTATPYRRIRSVRGAHAVIHTASGPVERRFWGFRSTPLRGMRSTDYEVRLRELFYEAVEVRLRSVAPVFAQLSGGLDSSSIVCAADVILKQREVAAPDLETISYVTDTAPEADERRFMACVEEQRGRATHFLRVDGYAVNDDGASITPIGPTRPVLDTFRLMKGKGGQVLLTGNGGDSVMANVVDYHCDVAATLRSGQCWAALLLARRRAHAAKRTVAGILTDAFVEALFPHLVLDRTLAQVLAAAGGRAPVTDKNVADTFLLRPAFAEWWREQWRAHHTEVMEFEDIAQRRPLGDLLRLSDNYHAQAPSEMPLAHPTHPYLHRPLATFMLNTPLDIAAPPGEPRALMRRAFASFVPQRILARRSKGYASPFIVRNLRTALNTWLERPQDLKLLDLECFDQDRLLHYLEGVRSNTNRQAFLASRLFKLAQWLDARDGRLQPVLR